MGTLLSKGHAGRIWARLLTLGIVLFGVGVGVSVSLDAVAQTYPSRPVRIVVPSGPGSGDDFVTRVVAAKLSEVLGQPFVVENRAGAGGVIGQSFVAKSAPDGYTLLLGGKSMAGARLVNRNADYDVLRDFSHIALIESSPFVLATGAGRPERTLGELLESARKQPGKLTYGTAGAGQIPYWGVQLINRTARIDALEVAFKNIGDVVVALMGGQIDYAVISVSAAMTDRARLHLLAVTGAQRSPALPDVPTMEEAGLPGYDMAAFRGLLGPKNMPGDIVMVLSDAMRRVLSMPDLIKQLKDAGSEPQYGNPEKTLAQYEAAGVIFQRLATEIGLVPQ